MYIDAPQQNHDTSSVHLSLNPHSTPFPPIKTNLNPSITSIPPITQHLRPRHKPSGLTRQPHRHPIQLPRQPQPPHGRHPAPMLLLPFQQRLPVQRRVHVPRRDGVYADPVRGPLRGQGARELGDCGFGGVVGALLLGVEDAGAGY